MRETIFISHARPDEDYFAAWLANKLRLLGYKVWVDSGNILSGDQYWLDIERIIRNETFRFVAIASHSYVEKANTFGSGVLRELNLAATVRNTPGFILPIRFGDCSTSQYPSIMLARDAVDFSDDWQIGLEKLLDTLIQLDTPKGNVTDFALQFWYEAQKIVASPKESQEKYYTNWFKSKLPEKVFVIQPEVIHDKIYSTLPYSFIRHGSSIITFTSPETVREHGQIIRFESYDAIQWTSDVPLKVEAQGLLINNPSRTLVNLMNKILNRYFRSKMNRYENANEKDVFYFDPNKWQGKRVSLKNFNRSNRTIANQTSNNLWSFGISHQAIIKPFIGYKISYHLIFTDLLGKPVNKDDMHELRRSVPSNWYNRHWFERLIATMYLAAGQQNRNVISIPVDESKLLSIDIIPISIQSPVGYNEPNNDE